MLQNFVIPRFDKDYYEGIYVSSKTALLLTSMEKYAATSMHIFQISE
jgi:hypothetical protein